MADIYMASCSLLENEKNVKEALDGVDPKRREEAAATDNVKKRAQILTAGLLIQHAARQFLGDKAPEGIYRVEKDAKGKPYFPDIPEVKFSVAHSGDMAVCAVSSLNVGVDIQEWRQLKADVAGRFFHPAETEYLRKLTPSESEKNFFAIWCLKESYIKYTGEGLGGGLDELDFTPVLPGGFAVFEFTEGKKSIRAELLEAPHGYTAAVIEELGE